MASQPSASPGAARSMTGYALVRRQTRWGELTCSLRSVNGRGLDLHFYLPGEFAPFENSLRGLLKNKVARGHLEVRLSLALTAGGERPPYNKALLERYLAAFDKANADFKLQSEPDLNRFFQLPGALDTKGETSALDDEFAIELLEATGTCADELNGFREREGAALVRAITAELQSIEESSGAITEIRGGIVPHLRDRLLERLKSLLMEVNLPEARFLEEAALLADKSDIEEELTRLEVHAGELRRILEAGGEVGKRLDFLLQEMNRETNTILSKSGSAGDLGIRITTLGLGVKANIERMREQSLNLE